MNILRESLQQAPVEASAPCRIDMGGTLDLSTFYLPLHHLKPCTFNAALNLRTHVRLEAYPSGKLKVTSRGFDSVEVDSHQAPFNHPLGLMMAVAAYFAADGVHIQIDSGSPPRSALGGSSTAAVALIWAFAKALANAGQPMPEPGSVALLAHSLEQSVAGVPCGLQDQLAAAFGGVNAWHWSADPDKPCYERQIVVPRPASSDFTQRLLVAYCGEPHVSKDINGTWVREFIAGRHRSLWRQIAALSREFVQALTDGHYDRAQQVMNQETDLRSRMTPDVLDEIGKPLVAMAREHGCSARFTGAGGGGCVWALGEPAHIRILRSIWQEILSRRDQARILEAAVDNDGIL